MAREFDRSKFAAITCFSALLCAAAIAAATLDTIPAVAAAADIATCDRLAALPEDKDRPADVKGTDAIDHADAPLALRACRAAAAEPDAPRRIAMQLGRVYEFIRQPAEAAKVYRRAANAGNTSAMVGLGVLLAEGDGIRKDEAEARMWFEKAALAGDPNGMTNLGSVYGGGVGVPVDLAAAREWYGKAAAANSSEGQYQLGLMTQDGDGGPKDDIAAKALFEKAAAQDHGGALERLGAFAETGRAGPKDEKAAIAFYKRAAALGSDDAANALDRMRCPFVLKDKAGKVAGNICFDGQK
jgi:TPR repeat protein